MKKSIDHCCEFMTKFVDDQRIPVYYSAVERQYGLRLRSGAIQLMLYCLWCGAKLPQWLGDKYFDTLEKEYNIDDPLGEQEELVPEEFKSDEWWKKRGL